MTRVNYIERQRLRAVDLRGEQDYLLGLDGRHVLAPHTWGIVCGLFVTVDGNKATVSPGLAIDGYGRELIVLSEVELTLPQSVGEKFVYLYYCERPQGHFGENAHTRWRDTAELIVTDQQWSISENEPELQLARAAGEITGYPPWPILLDVIGRTNSKDYPAFTSLRAARVLTPSNRALMRIGQETLADQYHFLISVGDGKGASVKRFAIDRDGNQHIWGNLLLQGSGYSAIVVVPQFNLAFSIEAPVAIGKNILWSVAPEVDRSGNETLQIFFREKKSSELIRRTILRPDNARSISSSLRSHNKSGLLVPLISTIRLPVAPREAGDPEPLAPTVDACATDNREQPLPRAGAFLKFLPEAEASDSAKFCECHDNDDREPKPPPGLVFNPSPSAPTVPGSRDIYTIRTGTPERSIEELRFTSGLFAKGDFTHGFSIGGSLRSTPFEPWLSVRGDGSVQLHGGKINSNTNKAFEMICVRGTAEYPPVKPDPRDPLFTFLMTFAFINGVLALSSSLVKLAIEAPKFIETNKPWEYKLSVQNLGLTEPLLPFAGIESIISDTATLNDQQFQKRLPAKVDKKKTEVVPITHKKGELPPGDEIQIEVLATMKAGSASVGDKKRSEKIPVYESPRFDDDIPESMTAGDKADIHFFILNGRSRNLTLNPIQIDFSGQTQSLTPKQTALGPKENTSTTEASIAAPAGVPSFTIVVTSSYLWEGETVPSEVKFEKIVKVEQSAPIP